MIAKHYIHFKFVKRGEKNFFLGVQEKLLNSQDSYTIITLTDADYTTIYTAEATVSKIDNALSETKFLHRLKTYPKIFRKFQTKLRTALAKFDKEAHLVLSTADEGVWGVLINQFKKELINEGYINTRTLNIQHGLYNPSPPKHLWIKKTVNKLTKLATGFPLIGYGFGMAGFDTYYVYTSLEKEFIQSLNPNSQVIIDLEICKHDVIKSYKKYTSRFSELDKEKSVLFCSQYLEISIEYTVTRNELYDKLFPVLTELMDQGYKLFYRLHPIETFKGELKNQRLQALAKHPNFHHANSEELTFYLAQTKHLLTAQSTVIFDALAVGNNVLIIDGFTRTKYHTEGAKNFDIDLPKEELFAKLN